MAYTEQVQQDLIGLMVGMFDAAPGQVIFNDVADAYRAGADYGVIAETLANTDEFKSIYGSNLTDRQYVTRLVNNMLDGHVTDQDEIDEVVDLFVAEMNAGATRAQVALAAAAALRDVDPNDPVWGQAGTAFANKVAVSTYYSIDAAQNGNDLAELQAVLAGVDHTDASVDAAKDAIDGTGTGGGDAAFLTANQDVVSGGAGDDLFIADVVAVDGLQVNSLNTGDRLDGGAGNDTLEAQVTQGATYGGSSMPIGARTTNIENVTFEAINANQGGSNTDVYIDAGNMVGLQNIGSSHSVGNLVIQNLTTRDNNGNLRLPSDLTITMSHTGTNNSAWDESDLHVYFAQNNLLTDVESDTTPSQANYWLLDQDSTDYKNKPLQNIDRDGITFTLDGVAHGVRPADSALLDVNDWEEFAQGIRDELAVMAAVAPELAGITVIVDWDNIRQTYNDDGVLIDIPAITLLDSNGGEFSNLGFIIPQDITGDFNVFGRTDTLAPVTTTTEYITTNVELEKVGRGGDGGELVIGGMEKGQGENNYRDVNGIEQFNVTVVGGEELPNSLSALRSTYNQLQIVNIESDPQGADSFASLQIGNYNSTGYGLKDVRVVNAVDFDGDLSITAELTTESFAKYADLFDTVGDYTEDNVYFDYSLTGEGDNALLLDVDMALVGNEDVVLSVLTDGGDDTVTVRLDVGGFTQNQYDNHAALDNVTIGTGAGDDVIWTPGSGNVAINAGSGNDTVYTDNVGFQSVYNTATPVPGSLVGTYKATWVTNASNTDITDLAGNGVGGEFFVPNAQLTVTFTSAVGVSQGTADRLNNGYEVTVDLPTGNGYVANHLHINQAIKAAINEDPILNKLLTAEDGPNGSLIIESQIDGQYSADALAINVSSKPGTSYNNAELQQLNNAYKEFVNDSTASVASSNAAITLVQGQLGNLGTSYEGVNGSIQGTVEGWTAGSPAVPATPYTPQEVSVDFGGLGDVTTAGDLEVTVNVDGTDYTVSVTLNVGDDATAIANAVAAAAVPANFSPALPAGVTFNAAANGTAVEFVFNEDAEAATVSVVGDGTVAFDDLPPVAEAQTIDFTGISVNVDGNIVVGGIAVAVDVTDTDSDIATAVAAAINAQQLTNPATAVAVSAAVVGATTVEIVYDLADGDVGEVGIGGTALLSGTPGVVTDQNYQPLTPTDDTDITVAVDQAFVPGVPAVPAVPAGLGQVDLTGANSTSLTDNVINLGTGQDVVVLSTSDEANETIVWTGHNNGKNTIVNFSETGNSIDSLDFSAYLTTQTSTSGSAASASVVPTTVQLGTAGDVDANEVIIVDFATLVSGLSAAQVTALGSNWNNLDSARLEAILNHNDSNWVRDPSGTSLYNSTNKAVFMIEGANDGDYKVFDVAFTNTASNLGSGFSVVGLIGQADFGDSLTAVTDVNFA